MVNLLTKKISLINPNRRSTKDCGKAIAEVVDNSRRRTSNLDQGLSVCDALK
jgi:hypothetical protein